MMRIFIRTGLGAVAGGIIGAIPGVLAHFIPALAVDVGYVGQIIYLGLLIGAAAGSIIGTMVAGLDILQGNGQSTSGRPAARAASR
jgi:hypothetical protein